MYRITGMGTGWEIYFPTIQVVVPLRDNSRDIANNQEFSLIRGDYYTQKGEGLFSVLSVLIWKLEFGDSKRPLYGKIPPNHGCRDFGSERVNPFASESRKARGSSQ